MKRQLSVGSSIFSREGLLAINRYLAGRLGLNPRFTISSNMAMAISRATGIRVSTAKLLFHVGVAAAAAKLSRRLGPGLAVRAGGAVAVFLWLERFDRSTPSR